MDVVAAIMDDRETILVSFKSRKNNEAGMINNSIIFETLYLCYVCRKDKIYF